MSTPATPTTHQALPTPPYRADQVAELLGVALPTVYEHARRDPERWGVIRIGRAVRFRKRTIDALVDDA